MIFMSIVMLMLGVISATGSFLQVTFQPLTEALENLIQML